MTAAAVPSIPTDRPVPVRAWVLSGAALALPLVVSLAVPEWLGEPASGLLWLTAVIPAFLFTFHRGWRGAALALAAGMAVISVGYAVLAVRGAAMPPWHAVLPVVVVLVGVSLAAGWLADLIRAQQRSAERMALVDPTTGLPNRRHTQIALDASFTGARTGTPLTVILFDIDHFRWLNEEHGHEAGDQVLKEVGGLLRRSLRDGEVVGRWGGGEFLAVLPGVGVEVARARADAMRAAVRDAPLRWQPVTLSVGVAAHGPHLATSDALVSAADEAVRLAKAEGRDRVAVHAFGGEAAEAVAIRPGPGGSSADVRPGSQDTSDALTGGAVRRDARVVVVDDEVPNLRVFGRALAALGIQHVETFQDPEQAVEAIEAAPPDLILLDLMMPGMSGFQVLEHLRPVFDEEGFLPVLILTGDRHPEVRERALRMGGKDFLNKPVDLTELEARILNLLESRALHRALRAARDRLEERVVERTRELEDARLEILRRLARAAEYRDDATGRHQERVGILAGRLAVRVGMDPGSVEVLRLAAPLHDLGKIAISDEILRHPGKLTREQFRTMQEHTRLGAELLSGSRHRILEVARVVALSHHERWDGRGYPLGSVGEDIPLVGRIVSVADVFDSLTHERPYKPAWTLEKALQVIRDDSGSAFDPQVVAALDELAERHLLDDLLGD